MIDRNRSGHCARKVSTTNYEPLIRVRKREEQGKDFFQRKVRDVL